MGFYSLLSICIVYIVICCFGYVESAISISNSIPAITRRDIYATRRQSRLKSVVKPENNERSLIDAIATGKSSELTLSIIELALCGAFASAFADFIMHPVDTIKVFQQTSSVSVSLLSAAVQIWNKSGFFGFYPGVGPYVLADGISGAIKFAVFEVTKSFSEARLPSSFHAIGRFICAAGAMLACSVTLVPGEVIKVRLQEGSYGGLTQLITTTFKNEGIGGFFAGYFATLVRDVPYTMLELGLYENLKALFRIIKGKNELNQQDELIAAALTGGITAILTTPLDLVKTKLMVQSAGVPVYGGVLDALQSVYANGGVSALFVGAAARFTWLLPFTMIYLPTYEIAKRNIARLRKVKI